MSTKPANYNPKANVAILMLMEAFYDMMYKAEEEGKIFEAVLPCGTESQVQSLMAELNAFRVAFRKHYVERVPMYPELDDSPTMVEGLKYDKMMFTKRQDADGMWWLKVINRNDKWGRFDPSKIMDLSREPEAA